jgi:hypothetical protein
VSVVVTSTGCPCSPAEADGEIESAAPLHADEVPGTSVVTAGAPCPAALSAVIENVYGVCGCKPPKVVKMLRLLVAQIAVCPVTSTGAMFGAEMV